MKSKLLVVMARVLAVATAVTALAESKKKEAAINEHVADQVQATSQAILRLKVQAAKPRGYQPPPIIFAPPPD